MRNWTGAGGLRLAGDQWGDPGRPLVMLLHGGGQTRHAWKGTGEALADAGYFTVAFDARGHGDSDWDPAGNYTQNAMVDDLVAVIAALGDRRPVLIGASMGGGTSLVAAGEGRVDTTALVLVDIAPKVELAGVYKIEAFMNQHPDGFDNLLDVAEVIATYQPHRDRPPNLDGLAKNVRRGVDGRFHWHWDPEIRTGHRDLDARQARLEACAAELSVPTLLVRGGRSDVLTEQGAQEFLTMCPHAEYVDVPDAAHMVAGDRNDIFGHAVIEFLTRIVPPDLEPESLPRLPRPRQPAVNRETTGIANMDIDITDIP